MRLFSTFLLLLFVILVKANNIDSLKQELSTSKGKEKVELLKELYNKVKYIDLDLSIEYAKQSIELTKQLKDTFNLGVAYRALGSSYSYKGYTELAMLNNQSSLKEFEKLNDELEIAKTKNNIANIYSKIGDTKQALINYNESFNTILKLNKEEYYSMFYLNISALYSKIGKVDTALYLLEKVKKLYKDDNKINITVPAKYNSSMADCYAKINELDSSLYYYDIAIKLAEKNKINYFLETAYHGYASVLLKLKKYSLASNYFLKSLELSLKSGNLANQSNAYKGLYSLNIETNKYKDATIYMSKYISIKDSLYEKRTSTRIEELRLLYDIDSKNKEITLIEKNSKIALLKSKNANSKTKQVLYLIIIVITVLVSISIIFIIQTRRKLLNSKLEKNKLKNSYLQKEVKYKTTQLTDFALYIIKRNDFLRDVNTQLKKIKKNANSEILPDIRNVEDLIKYSINISKDRKEFNSQVELVNQEFYEKIEQKYPELTKNEKNIAILLKLNLSSKEIASILNVSSKSIDNYRYNIRKKLNLTPKEDLNTILNNI